VKYCILIILTSGEAVWLAKDKLGYMSFDYRTVADREAAHVMLSYRSALRHWQLANEMYGSGATSIHITVS